MNLSGEWILVQAHAFSHCLGRAASASFCGFPWGWVQRSTWVESLQKMHVFLRPIPTSLKEMRKYKFMSSMPSMTSMKEHVSEEDQASHIDTSQSKTETVIAETNDTEALIMTSQLSDYNENTEDVVCWYEQYDQATGYMYYYNSVTGESKWEAPEWVVEYDNYSGIRCVRFT